MTVSAVTGVTSAEQVSRNDDSGSHDMKPLLVFSVPGAEDLNGWLLNQVAGIPVMDQNFEELSCLFFCLSWEKQV